MVFTRAWRNFKRMQDLTVAAASLIYAAATVHAVGVLPGGAAATLRWTLVWPALWLVAPEELFHPSTHESFAI